MIRTEPVAIAVLMFLTMSLTWIVASYYGQLNLATEQLRVLQAQVEKQRDTIDLLDRKVAGIEIKAQIYTDWARNIRGYR